MLALSFHVVRAAFLSLALIFSFISANLSRRDPNASGTVHVRDESHIKYRAPAAKLLAESATSQTTAIAATAPTFQISEEELKNVLGIKLEFDLNLDVVHDSVDAVVGRTQSSVGRIPVHIKIHELTIGGILAPSLTVNDVNLQSDPVNYGNMRVI
ncbi:hypothetical protein BGZ82_009302 [Podila clonocystis]|nr:hypothetical protein BGZ82_009302 [Podila clonocystis]